MKTRAYFFIITAGILWGTSGLFVNALAPYGFSSLQMTAMRGIVATISMPLYCFFTDKTLFKISPLHLLLCVLSGISMYGTSCFYYMSMRASSVSTAVMLMYTAPIIVMIFSVLFFGEKLTGKKLLAVGCMLVGCAFVSGIIGGFKFDAWGITAGFLAGLSYSSYNILTKIQMRMGIRPQSASLYCFIFMGILATTFSNPSELFLITAKDPIGILPFFVGIGLFTTVVPYLLYTFAMRALPAGTTSALGIVEPMSATVFSILFLSEKPGVFSVTGIVLIIAAVLILGLCTHDECEV